jgi:mannitol/fructose-specific phosphotransferase system IIA component (Ntr-type)
MHPVVNHLIQLQELTLIREEQKVLSGGEHTQQLDESIAGMTKRLPADTRMMFEKLHKKDHIVIGPVSDGSCAVCGMKLPISQVQAVRIGKSVISCHNCARMLYFPETATRRVAERRRRADTPKVGISRFSSHTLMVPGLEAKDKEGAIAELAYKMENEGFVDRGDWLVEEALRRDAILSTAVDHGLAFPHVRGVEGGGLTLAVGVSKKGIRFDGSKNLTRVIFFMAIPTAASAFYLKLLAGLTEAFRKPEVRKAVVSEKDPEKLWKTLCKVTRTTIK